MIATRRSNDRLALSDSGKNIARLGVASEVP